MSQFHKPCPFCGGDTLEVFAEAMSPNMTVACRKCHAKASAEVWNDRVSLERDEIREAVYRVIDGERDYQRNKWGEKPHEIDAFAAYIAEYTAQLLHVAGTSGNANDKLHAVRKVGALAVACMEQHGAPLR